MGANENWAISLEGGVLRCADAALNGGNTLTHGWRPETGFIAHRWNSYSELMGLYLLGIGTPAHALPPESWDAWSRAPVDTRGGHTFIRGGALFTHQYTHAWFDFRDQHDEHADYWQNSVEATLAQRECSASVDGPFAIDALIHRSFRSSGPSTGNSGRAEKPDVDLRWEWSFDLGSLPRWQWILSWVAVRDLS